MNRDATMGKEIKIIAIPLTIIGIFLTICALYNTFSYGQGECIPPSEFAILRGYHGSFPSDLLVVPINWRNNGARYELIENLSLDMTLKEMDRKTLDNRTIKKRWILLGTIRDISGATIEDNRPYSYLQDLIIQPHSITQTFCVFQIEDYWNEKSKNHDFKFNSSYNRWDVDINFNIDGISGGGKLFELPVYEAVDKMNASSKYTWDYFQIDAPQKFDSINWSSNTPAWQNWLRPNLDFFISIIFIVLGLYLLGLIVYNLYLLKKYLQGRKSRMKKRVQESRP